MGKRSEWDQAEINVALASAGGNLAGAAKLMNEIRGDRWKVTRQNLQTWINTDEDADAHDMIDTAEVLRKNRNLTNTNNQLRREQRHMLDATLAKQATLQAIGQACAAAAPTWPKPFISAPVNGRAVTIELLFSDIQIGKLMNDYDTEVALKRADEYVRVAQQRIEAYGAQGFSVEKIVLAVLGDIIESDKKHSNSGRACDIGTADQVKVGIEVLFQKVIKGLSYLAPLEVVMITGNHDHDDHGLNMFMPGREHLSWPLYHAVRMLTEQAGIDATFDIPEGSFATKEIYGQTFLYEHGVGVAASGAALKKHAGNRMDQLKKFISFVRIGDKHNISRFNNDRFVVNGAFFGDSRHGEEYSGIAGYDGEPAQLMFAHVQRADNFRTSIFDSLAIQLGHIK